MQHTSTAGMTAALRWRRGLALRSQAARGDDAALAAMYERHHQALYRYCRSILHDDEDARDALQSTMAKALAALRGEERDFELRPWLFRIAHNEAISRLRQRRDVLDLDAIGSLGTDSLPQTVEDRERVALLRADLRDLPERQRSALVLRELCGLSHEEIAAVHAGSARAIKQTIFEARAALQECSEGRTMLCADVQRMLSDGDGRVLRGRRVRAHVRSCRACRSFKVALAQRPADLAALAPALPATAGAALLAQVLPGAKAGLVSSAATATAGAGGGLAATVSTKVAIVAVATATLAGTGSAVRDALTAPATLAGTGSAVRDALTAPDRARPAAAAPAAAPSPPPATAPSLRAAALTPVAGQAGRVSRRSPASADRRAAGASRHAAQAQAVRAHGTPAAHAAHGRRNATGQATAQAKRQARAKADGTVTPDRGRRARPKAAKSHPAHPGAGTRQAPSATKAHPAHRERPAVAATPTPGVQPQSAANAPAVTAPGNSGSAHAAK